MSPSNTPEAESSDLPKAEASEREVQKRRRKWRLQLRALHRDVGYFAVGLTFIYAMSGLAVNHIADWEPNFNEFERTVALTNPLPSDDQEAAKSVARELDIDLELNDIYRTDDELELIFGSEGTRQVVVNLERNEALDRGREPRFFLRMANWLHLNRGKKAWTYVADAYAVFLLFLASSGLFMLPGKNGLKGRGWVFVALGVLVPTLYVLFSGGPSA